VKVTFCFIYYGSEQSCQDWVTLNGWNTGASGQNKISLKFAVDAATTKINQYVSLNGNQVKPGWTFYVLKQYMPNLGDASIYTQGTELITVKEAFLQTGSTLNVKLTQCLTTAQWQALVQQTLGLSASQVAVRPLGNNANCNNAKRVLREADATFAAFQTNVFSTEAQTSASLAAQLQAEGAAIGIQSAEVVAFTEPVAATQAATAVPSAAGGGGGGGFSDGAIAGIVVGSTVGGGLIILSVLAIAGLVAYKVFKSDDKYSQETQRSGGGAAEPSKGRRTMFFFKNKDAVDVHNLEQGSHQSITARAPPAN
jgi:hypothetical protein